MYTYITAKQIELESQVLKYFKFSTFQPIAIVQISLKTSTSFTILKTVFRFFFMWYLCFARAKYGLIAV